MRNVFCMSVFHRKCLSLALLLVLLSLFCLISTSIIDVFTESSHQKHSQYKGNTLLSVNVFLCSSARLLVADKDNLVSGTHVHKYAAKLGKIQLEEILQNELSADYFNGSWVSPEQIAYYDAEYNLCLYNSSSKVVTHLVRFPFVVSAPVSHLSSLLHSRA